MNISRMKLSEQGCYYHLYNRIAGVKGVHPFDDSDKEYGFRLLKNLSEYFLVEIISAAWMGNHFHLVVYAPGPDELPDTVDIATRHNSYYNKMRRNLTYAGSQLPRLDPQDTAKCHEIGLKMIDISYFMRALQQRYTVVFNKNRNRIGHLWADRFKSVILDKQDSLETCVMYVELNPVRAGLKNNPADYQFTTWGRYCGSGQHMFYDNFVKHLKQNIRTAGDPTQWSDNELFAYFRGELARIIAMESGADTVEIHQAQQQAKRGESMPIRFLRRTRHFTDGAIIGSKQFIREIGSMFENPERVKQKQLSRGFGPAGDPIYCFRKLQR